MPWKANYRSDTIRKKRPKVRITDIAMKRICDQLFKSVRNSLYKATVFSNKSLCGFWCCEGEMLDWYNFDCESSS